jgi:MoxR-like ATPase
MLKVVVGYPSEVEEKQIMQLTARTATREPLTAVVQPETILEMRKLVDQVFVDPQIEDYIVRLVFATREPARFVPQLVGMIRFGASPRATINLALAAKARAFIYGRGYVLPEDIKSIAPDVLRHRVITTFEADADDITSEKIVAHILETVPVP